MSNQEQPPERNKLQTQFLSQVQQGEGCWPWLGSKSNKVYGQTKGVLRRDIDTFAHRCSYKLFVGAVSPRAVVRHLCNNPICVNPKHLALGTQKDNYNDSVKAGTAPFGERNGHAKLSTATVAEIKRLLGDGVRPFEIARQLNVHRTVVCDIKSGKRRRNG